DGEGDQGGELFGLAGAAHRHAGHPAGGDLRVVGAGHEGTQAAVGNQAGRDHVDGDALGCQVLGQGATEAGDRGFDTGVDVLAGPPVTSPGAGLRWRMEAGRRWRGRRLATALPMPKPWPSSLRAPPPVTTATRAKWRPPAEEFKVQGSRFKVRALAL